MKVLAGVVLALVLVLAMFVALVGAMLATYPWMVGRAALQSQQWTSRLGTVASTSVPIDQWPLILSAAQGSTCGVRPEDLAAIAQTESNFGRNMATNASGHFGYGQFDAAT